MQEATTTLLYSHERAEKKFEQGQVVAFDLGIKTLAIGTNNRGVSTTWAASKAHASITNN